MLTNNLKSQIKTHSLELPNEEVCGFILDDNTVIKARNTSFNKSKNFSIHPEDYINAENSGNIVGIYHSHPSKNNNFSDFDKINAENHNKIYIMYCLKTDTFHEFYPGNYKNKYIGIKFDYKTNNCFTIIKNFYKQELNIEIDVNSEFVNIDEKWYEKNPELYRDIWKLNPNFLEVMNKNNIQKYDIILFNYVDISRPGHHFAIYLDDNTFLHLPRKSFSKIEVFDKHYQDKVTNIFRHKKLIKEELK